MTETALTVMFFCFVMASVGAALLVFRWIGEPRLPDAAAGAVPGRQSQGLRQQFIASMLVLGELARPGGAGPLPLRSRLQAAGFRSPSATAVFHGVRIAFALLLALALGWTGLLRHESLSAGALAAVCGLGFGFLLPERVLDAMIQSRATRIDRALPNALDLMVLSIEAGQTLDSALVETSRELRHVYPELAAEFAQVQIELRAGRTRSEVLYGLGQRTNSAELRKLATVLTDSDRFGTSLGPALRTHAKYLRTKRRQLAQEAARKLSVKLIFPVFFLIMPAVFVVTLGPALLTFYEALGPALGR